MKNSFCIFLYLFGLIFFSSLDENLSAQNNSPAKKNEKADSLKNFLKTAKEDTNKVIVLNKLCWLLRNDPSAITYSREALQLATKLHYDLGIATACNHMGVMYRNTGDYKKSLENHFISLDVSIKMNNKPSIARAYNSIAIAYLNQGDYPKSLTYHYKALQLRTELNDKEGQSSSLNNIGSIHHHLGDYTKALEFF